MASLLTDDGAMAMARILRDVHLRRTAAREFMEGAAAALAPAVLRNDVADIRHPPTTDDMTLELDNVGRHHGGER